MPEPTTEILLVSASEMEMLREPIGKIDKLVTGVGMVASTHQLTKRLSSNKYDLVVDIGIAGAFNPQLSLGTVVQVIEDRLVEMGVEDNGAFIPADEMNLVPSYDVQFSTQSRIKDLPAAKGITVNRVHGSAESIEQVVKQFNPDIESMEGAAVAYVCQQFGVPWVQIRAISNRVEPRNRDVWNIPLAIENLHTVVLNYLQHEA
jgi:futalosine hydrolase